jgi:hypothetical protein
MASEIGDKDLVGGLALPDGVDTMRLHPTKP